MRHFEPCTTIKILHVDVKTGNIAIVLPSRVRDKSNCAGQVLGRVRRARSDSIEANLKF